MTKKKGKILIVRLSSLGDVIFSLPLAAVLKKNGFQTGWLVSEKGIDIVKNNPCVDKVYLAPLGKWKKKGFCLENFKEFLSILKEIRNEKYDIALDCQQAFKSLYWMLFCGAKRRITHKYSRELAFLGGNEHIPNPYKSDFSCHAVEMHLEYARYLGLETHKPEFTLPPCDTETREKVDNLLKNIDKSKPVAVISPATTWRLKHWDKDNWRELISFLKDKFNLIFTGTTDNNELITYISEGNGINLAGKTTIKDLAEIFSRSDLVISPDSGSAHVAWAVQKPVVIGIFTCTPPSLFGAYGDPNKYFAINGKLDCQPCFTRTCPLSDGKEKCLKHPTAKEIINIVKKVFEFKENCV